MSITEDRVVDGRKGRATFVAADRIAAFAKATEAYAETLDDPDLANVYWGKSLGLRQAVAILADEYEAPPAKPAVSPEVTALARSAGEVGRLLVVRDLNTSAAGYLTRGWEDLLPPAVPPGPFDAAGGRGKASGRACLHRSNLGNESPY